MVLAKPFSEHVVLGAELTEAVRTLLEEAAKTVLLPRYRNLTHAEVFEKAKDELVTIADRECEAMLVEGLATILPAASIVGEEAVEEDANLLKQLGAPLCWIIDPLDGTANFASGTGPFGIMVALAMEGEPVGGWILDPIERRFSSAIRGQGAYSNGQRLRARPSGALRPRVALSSLLQRRPERYTEVVRRLEPAHDLVPAPRCAAHHYPEMILGFCDATLYERTLAWDHAAGVLLLEEAGGRCARLDGADYVTDTDRVGMLAATDLSVWSELVERLQDLPE